MKIYLLKRLDKKIIYDTQDGCVVRAESEEEARQVASQSAGDEGRDAWLDEKQSSCEVLTARGQAGLILRDFNAG